MIIGLDADEVLLDSQSVWVARAEELLGRRINRERILNWDFSPEIRSEERQLFWKARTPSMYAEVQPLDGAQLGVRMLKRVIKHRVYVVTSDSYRFVHAKARCLRYWFPELDGIVVVKNKSSVRLDVLLDDGLHNTPTHLFTQSWNRNKRYAGTRVNSWYEFLDRVVPGWYVN